MVYQDCLIFLVVVTRSPPVNLMNKNATRPSAPRVALLINPADAYGRRVLSGMARYLRENGRWSVFMPEDWTGDAVSKWLESWRGEGVICHTVDQTVLTVIKRLGTPAVSLRDVPPFLNIPMVLTDNSVAARLAFEHFHERGFRQFAYCGRVGVDSSDECQRSFHDCATAAGLPGSFLEAAKPPSTKSGDDGKDLARWITELPKPVGIMAADDRRGRQILDACRTLKIPVPDQVAVIGVDNDAVLCDLTDPPLSSVDPNAEQAGCQAAALLDRLMAGHPAPQKRLLVAPPGVIARRSTDIFVIEDEQVAAAARFIHEHACEGITVDTVARAAHISRRVLERRYALRLGRSLKHDILEARLDAAKQLLTETNLPATDIAKKIGINGRRSFDRTFTKSVGMSPAAFRDRARAAILEASTH